MQEFTAEQLKQALQLTDLQPVVKAAIEKRLIKLEHEHDQQ
ncbi:hypothetical protein [Oceanobacter kriegii]|nr:hypothetical protein [Oceanobacter kriegii]